MKLLDLFCGAGGASTGYNRAGFEVVGVDIKPQPRYPFEIHQADAMTYPLDGFDAIHASPPCQAYSVLTPKAYKARHPDLIASLRRRLISSSIPFVIENVSGARHLLLNPIMLCGTAFGLHTHRHRWFELSSFWMLVSPCKRIIDPIVVSGTTRKNPRRDSSAKDRRIAMDTQWMRVIDMDEAIPPAYTEFIGHHLLDAIRTRRQMA